MRRCVLTAALVAAGAAAALAEGGVNWVEGYENGLAAAKESGKLLMIEFFSS